jgi:hypothetical protein
MEYLSWKLVLSIPTNNKSFAENSKANYQYYVLISSTATGCHTISMV